MKTPNIHKNANKSSINSIIKANTKQHELLHHNKTTPTDFVLQLYHGILEKHELSYNEAFT